MQMSHLAKALIVNFAYRVHSEASIRYFSARAYQQNFGPTPKTLKDDTGFSEKIYFRKIWDRNPEMSRMADKVLVKEIVRSRIGDRYVIPTLWNGTDMSSLRTTMKSLTEPFVVKANHGSGWNIFVRNAAERKYEEIVEKCRAWLSQTYGRTRGEWLYSGIEPQILIEPYISGLSGLPIDYKFFVFSGKAHYIQIDTDRETNHKRCFYDTSWTKQSFELGFPLEPAEIERPASLDEMIHAAESLVRDFSFARVDFYEIEGVPLFGETTFYPGSGLEKFTPTHWNERLGQLWH